MRLEEQNLGQKVLGDKFSETQSPDCLIFLYLNHCQLICNNRKLTMTLEISTIIFFPRHQREFLLQKSIMSNKILSYNTKEIHLMCCI